MQVKKKVLYLISIVCIFLVSIYTLLVSIFTCNKALHQFYLVSDTSTYRFMGFWILDIVYIIITLICIIVIIILIIKMKRMKKNN